VEHVVIVTLDWVQSDRHRLQSSSALANGSRRNAGGVRSSRVAFQREARTISNLLVVGLLFVVGYHWAKYVDDASTDFTHGHGLFRNSCHNLTLLHDPPSVTPLEPWPEIPSFTARAL
jgi:hypothetical protein